MNKILILENSKLDKQDQMYVFNFLKNYKGEIIDFSLLRSKTDIEIWEAINNCTDIITQSCFINGSDNQVYQFLYLLAKVKEPKNIYIAFLGGDLKKWFTYLEIRQILMIKHHNIFELRYEGNFNKISFADILIPYYRQQIKEKQYNQSAKNRLTGNRIKILTCNATGKGFDQLIINNIYDEVDMSEFDPNINRGVWIVSDNIPIKVVNDLNNNEYEIVSKLSTHDLIVEIFKSVYLKLKDLDRKTYIYLTAIIKMDEKELSNLMKANILCEDLGIEKRRNRAVINNLLIKNSKWEKK